MPVICPTCQILFGVAVDLSAKAFLFKSLQVPLLNSATSTPSFEHHFHTGARVDRDKGRCLCSQGGNFSAAAVLSLLTHNPARGYHHEEDFDYRGSDANRFIRNLLRRLKQKWRLGNGARDTDEQHHDNWFYPRCLGIRTGRPDERQDDDRKRQRSFRIFARRSNE
jgi:hypothetical protein